MVNMKRSAGRWVAMHLIALPLVALPGYGEPSATGLESVPDVRVAPLVSSKWSQHVFGGEATFNLYLPNRYPSGCVVAAFAQVMRYWRFPVDAVPAASCTCWQDGFSGVYSMMGGVYDWDAMPLLAEDCTEDAQRQMLARLTYDLCVASHTDWSQWSGTYNVLAAEALKRYFGYASARTFNPGPESVVSGVNILNRPDYRNAVLASLDAGMPVVLGFANRDNITHQAVVDGYGFNGDGDLYCHLNCGWEGADDRWYNVIAEDVTDQFHFTAVNDIAYNIHPTEAGDIISGRVLDAAGLPVPDVTVRLAGPGKNDETTAQSNAQGIYFFRFSAKGKYVLSVRDDVHGRATRTVDIDKAGADINGELNEERHAYYMSSRGIVANRWGVDLVLAPAGEDIGEEDVSGTLDAALDKAQTVVGALYDEKDALAGTVQLKVGKINTKRRQVKVSASVTLMDGKKRASKSVSLTLSEDGALDGGLVFKNPVGTLAFAMAPDGAFSLKSASYKMKAATVGGALKGGEKGTFTLEDFDLAVPGELQGDLLPTNATFTVAGGRWKFDKNASVKWAKDRTTKEYGLVVDTSKGKTNLSSLKLTYAAKTGVFKGSFKAYALETAKGKTKLKKYTVNVIGFVVDGVGYGEAFCKKPSGGPWPVTVQ